MTEPAPGEPFITETMPAMPVIFYDGDCGFCNGSVRFVLDHEQKPATLFAPIQGETAARILKESPLPADIGKRTMILFENGKFLLRAQAVLRTMELMGGGWAKLSKILRIIPRPLSNGAYRIVARMRQILPAGQSCAMLPPEQRKRFLP